MRPKIVVTAIAIGFGLGGCHRYCEPRIPDKDLIAQYSNRSLGEVYEKHLELVSNCTPPRSTLASRLAEFGPAAKTYALSKLVPGDSRSFLAASSTVSMVNTLNKTTCTNAELAKLEGAAKQLFVGEARSIYVNSVRDACRLERIESTKNARTTVE